jgi:group II intron reverse transcriptase/maturase
VLGETQHSKRDSKIDLTKNVISYEKKKENSMKKTIVKFNIDEKFEKGHNELGIFCKESSEIPLLAPVTNSNNSTPSEDIMPNEALDSKQVERKSIEDMVKDRFKNGKYRKLIEIIADEDFLKAAYERIKSKPGNMSPGGDSGRETLDGIDKKWFKQTSKELLDGTYRVKPLRRVMIEKPGKTEKRPLTIGSPRDKIIQEAIRSILSCIYEPKFTNYSHGFRPNKSAHTALKELKSWREATWFLEFDIKKCFDTINRKRLVNILQEEIQDQGLFDILHKMFQAKVINLEFGNEDNEIGTPQGSIISPILCNIYLNKLDTHVKELILNTNKGDQRKRNPEYRREVEVPRGTPWSIRREKHRKALREGLTATLRDDETFRKLKYVRYADDFLLAFAGTKIEANKIFANITTFIKSDLKLDVAPDKSRIVQAIDRKIKFLGFYITAVPSKDNPLRLVQKGNFMEHRRRVLNRLKDASEKNMRIFLKQAKKDLIRKAASKGRKMGSKEKNQLSEVELNALAKLLSLEDSLDEKHRFDSTISTILSRTDNEKVLPQVVFAAHEILSKIIASETSEACNELHLAKSTGITSDKKKISMRRLSLPLQLYIPLEGIRDKLRKRGIMSKGGKPSALVALQNENPRHISQYYASVARGFLEYYSPATNFHRLKGIVNYHIRWSLLHTLARKHRTSLKKVIEIYGKNLEHNADTKGTFPSKSVIAGWKRGFRSTTDAPTNPSEHLNRIWLRRTRLVDGSVCIVEGCELPPEMHHVRQIKARTDRKGNVSVINSKGIRKDGIQAYMISKNRKQLALCPEHHKMAHKDQLRFREKKVFADDA